MSSRMTTRSKSAQTKPLWAWSIVPFQPSHTPIPPELLASVASYADNGTRANLLRLSRQSYDIVGPILYERLTLSRENAWSVFRGLARSAYTTPKRQLRPEVQEALDKRSYLKQPFVLSWPDIQLESDEDDACDDDEVPPPTQPSVSTGATRMKARVYVATERSHDRKLALLQFVKYLTIESIPRRLVARHLQSWTNMLHIEYSDRNRQYLFERATHLSYCAHAIFQLAEWRNRQRSGLLRSQHPFMEALTASIKARHICYTLPYGIDLWYDLRRIRGNSESDRWLNISQSYGQYERLDDDYRTLMQGLSDIELELQISDIETMSIHQFRGGRLQCHTPHIRIFFACSGCSPRGSHWSDPDGNECPSQGSWSTHLSTLGTLMESITDQKRENAKPERIQKRPVTDSWEWISPAPKEMKKYTFTWKKMKEVILRCYPGWKEEEVEMTTWAKAAPCECCGTKQGI